MNVLRVLLVMLAILLAGCETTDGHLLTYAAQGTVIQAERLVAKVYGHPTKPLPYSGANIEQPLQRMQARWPKLQAELAKGSLGLSDTGYVAIHEKGSHPAELRKLVRAENLDRQILYMAMSEEVGHGGAFILTWLPYTEDVFAGEWIKQAPPGWWFLDAEQVWRRTPPPAVKQ
ncbi:MAG: DUF1318 domain-containing protein [Betaproteobacteria bacterium]